MTWVAPACINDSVGGGKPSATFSSSFTALQGKPTYVVHSIRMLLTLRSTSSTTIRTILNTENTSGTWVRSHCVYFMYNLQDCGSPAGILSRIERMQWVLNLRLVTKFASRIAFAVSRKSKGLLLLRTDRIDTPPTNNPDKQDQTRTNCSNMPTGPC